jgi:hypothetical protein
MNLLRQKITQFTQKHLELLPRIHMWSIPQPAICKYAKNFEKILKDFENCEEYREEFFE